MAGLLGKKKEKTPLPAPFLKGAHAAGPASGPAGAETPLFVPDPGTAAYRPWAAPARAAGLLGRIRNLRSEDLACIIVGCVMLLSGPLVERWVSSTGESTDMQQGFSSPDAAFPDPDAERGLLGPNRDPGGYGAPVVTPLNAADPTGLVMGLEGGGVAERSLLAGVDQKDKRQAPPPAAEKKSGGWRDALEAAKRGTGEATRTASLPRPSSKLQGALRGLAALQSSGGSGAKGQAPALAAPSQTKLFSAPRVRDSIALSQAIPGYMGPAARGLSRSSGLSKGALETAAQRAGSYFDKGGGTLREAIDAPKVSGGGFSMGGRDGEASKGGANSSKDQKTFTEKETLAQMKAKLELQKAIDLKWEKKKYEELDRKKMIEQIIAQTLAQTANQAFMKVFNAVVDKLFGTGGGGQQGNVQGGPVGS